MGLGLVGASLERRRWRKQISELGRHARHLRHMREDVMSEVELAQLQAVLTALKALHAEGPHAPSAQAERERCHESLDKLTPRRWKSSVRENLDVALVAIGVAMAFRAYILQPFKIPTGSMQPTLMGIYSDDSSSPTILDRYPLKLAKWMVFGTWYRDIRADRDGVVSGLQDHPKKSWVKYCLIRSDSGTVKYKLPSDACTGGRLAVRQNTAVQKGDLIWSGYVTRGDHVFVNKMLWNFRAPRRGEIMVFETENIPSLPPGTHYIKRMCGLPGEHLEIQPPNLLIDGMEVTKPATIARIAGQEPGYSGYQYAGAYSDIQLGDGQYVALGDNTGNSRDSRYWGPVPAENLVGPAAGIYWPISKRWGLAR